MKKSNIGAIVLLFILISVIKSIGIENIPFPVIVIILILCMAGAFLIALKYKGNKVERMYLLVMTILITLIFTVVVIGIAIENNYPQISEQYKPIFIDSVPILFFITLIVAIANAIYKYTNKR